MRKLSAAARTWWQSLVSDPHSFSKPTFLLGLNGWSVTNILPDGAHERTPGHVELLPNGAAGFSKVGDSMCFSINVSGLCVLCNGRLCGCLTITGWGLTHPVAIATAVAFL